MILFQCAIIHGSNISTINATIGKNAALQNIYTAASCYVQWRLGEPRLLKESKFITGGIFTEETRLFNRF